MDEPLDRTRMGPIVHLVQGESQIERGLCGLYLVVLVVLLGIIPEWP